MRYFIHPESSCCWSQQDDEPVESDGLVEEVDQVAFLRYQQTLEPKLMTSAFNPETFLDQGTTEAGTRRPPVSSGLEFLGIIKDFKSRVTEGKKDPSKTYVFCDAILELDLTTQPQEVQRLGVERVSLRHSGSLDVLPNGELDWSPGKNRFLTAYREATNLNNPGSAFSVRMLIGRIVRAKVGHRTGEQNDPLTGRPEIYDEISGVARP